ncbi:MAG TPA: Coenzyme F420 hydrogenase/dehydrogenase, beta subunit C-terminal domain [Candidatus Nitrosocosmicus sp.]|nr:Coenzyme F420 hydrogenase/dehydrogenase, beta subunit C-terminal domain [Candidatus Nitrosocosmicus sp.]
MKNVGRVVKDSLCTGCGACYGVCPANAVKMVIDEYGIYSPQISHELCTNCGLCLKACPGVGIDYKKYMMKIHGSLPENVAIGPYIKSYAGYVKDKLILEKAQSGGFVSSLLIYSIENNIIDGAVVTSWDENDPLSPKVYIARDRDEILKAVGSKYNPIPVSAIIKEVSNLEGRYAFVGTSCQIQGMRKAEENVRGLSSKIAFYIGLHCYNAINYYFQDQILYKIKKNRSDIEYFRERDKEWRGWPCDMLIRTKDGETINIPGSISRLWPKSYFSNWRCKLCFDKFNEFSDVSCGDCRIPSHYGKKSMSEVHYSGLAKSDIVVRTKRAEEIVQKMINEGILIVEESEVNDLISSVRVAEKKIGVNYFSAFIEKIGGKAPEYGIKFEIEDSLNNKKNRILEAYSVLAAGHYYMCYKLTKYRAFRYLLKKTPHKLLGILESIREKFANYKRIGNYTRLSLNVNGKKSSN